MIGVAAMVRRGWATVLILGGEGGGRKPKRDTLLFEAILFLFQEPANLHSQREQLLRVLLLSSQRT